MPAMAQLVSTLSARRYRPRAISARRGARQSRILRINFQPSRQRVAGVLIYQQTFERAACIHHYLLWQFI